MASNETEEIPFFDTLARSVDEQPASILADIKSRILIWYDYASMLQEPRTEAEESEFREEIVTLNDIQSNAGTVVIAGDDQYLSRAWCFLEMCGGMRNRITELTPTWGKTISVGDSVTTWASRSDQLIAALNTLGLESIHGSHLEATHSEDLSQIALLLSRLPLTGLIESDDSDLVGGTLPTPFRNGEWFTSAAIGSVEARHDVNLAKIDDFGNISDFTTDIARKIPGKDSIGGDIGIWVYTTNHALTLSWSARAHEFCKNIRSGLREIVDDADLLSAVECESGANVACLWADSRALSDNGDGFTRAIPSTAKTLVVITQADIPEICRIYDRVVKDHVAFGSHVICFSPETGRTLVYAPLSESEIHRNEGTAMNVMAVPRLRRSDMAVRRMFVAASAAAEDVEVLPALRLDPAFGVIGDGEQHEYDDEKGEFVPNGESLDAAWLIRHSRMRTRIEGLSRSISAMWNDWFPPLVHQERWMMGLSPMQIEILEALITKTQAEWENPFERRRFLKLLVKEHEGYLLPPSIVDGANIFIEEIRKAEQNGAGQLGSSG